MNKAVFTIAAAAVVGATTLAFAHSGATGIVKQRMDAMSAMKDTVKSLTTIMRGEAPYDPSQVKEAAAVIKSHSADSMTRLFPEGSIEGKSEARPEIWSNWEEFETLANQLAIFAEALDAASENGLMMAGNAGPGQTGPGQMGGTGMMGAGQMGGAGMMGAGNSMMTPGAMMGTGTMMGSGAMMGGSPAVPDAETLAAMPADGVFNMLTATCTACHTKFRIEKNKK